MLVWKACFYDSPMTKVCVSKLDISYDGTKRSTVGKLLVVSLFACGHRRVLLLAEYVRVQTAAAVLPAALDLIIGQRGTWNTESISLGLFVLTCDEDVPCDNM